MAFQLQPIEVFTAQRLAQVATAASDNQQYQYFDRIEIVRMNQNEINYLLTGIESLDDSPFKQRISRMAKAKQNFLKQQQESQDTQRAKRKDRSVTIRVALLVALVSLLAFFRPLTLVQVTQELRILTEVIISAILNEQNFAFLLKEFQNRQKYFWMIEINIKQFEAIQLGINFGEMFFWFFCVIIKFSLISFLYTEAIQLYNYIPTSAFAGLPVLLSPCERTSTARREHRSALLRSMGLYISKMANNLQQIREDKSAPPADI